MFIIDNPCAGEPDGIYLWADPLKIQGTPPVFANSPYSLPGRENTWSLVLMSQEVMLGCLAKDP